jgi:hypothetical protein
MRELTGVTGERKNSDIAFFCSHFKDLGTTKIVIRYAWKV